MELCVDLLELPASPFDLEFPTAYLRSSLPERALQLFELGEVLASLPRALFGQMARQAQQLVTVWLAVRTPRLCLPTARLPGVAAPAHAWSVAWLVAGLVPPSRGRAAAGRR